MRSISRTVTLEKMLITALVDVEEVVIAVEVEGEVVGLGALLAVDIRGEESAYPATSHPRCLGWCLGVLEVPLANLKVEPFLVESRVVCIPLANPRPARTSCAGASRRGWRRPGGRYR